MSKKQIGLSLLTVAIYTVLFGWKLAILISATISWHEMSHLWAAKRLKLSTGSFTLIPLIGGVSFITERYKSYAQQCFVVIMGPIGGSLLGFALAGIGLLLHQPSLIWAAYWNLFVNLANLALPISGILDAGQLMNCITYSINKTLGVIGYCLSTLVGVVLLFVFFSPLLAAVILYFGGQSAYKEFKNWQAYREGKFHLCSYEYLLPPKALSIKQILTVMTCWLISIGVMGSTMVYLHAYTH
jgi:hypothetical protein